ncbi:MAG: TIGR02450 family Trp-rich protein [Turneriella sp.]|nr:TIGR02450 family Trp-rich protein [Turneriella sp.]
MPQKANIPFAKILGSKWTAVEPQNGEKHFLVTRIADQKSRELKLECVVTKRTLFISYEELSQSGRYLSGWR